MTSGHSALSSALNTGSSGHARLPTASLTLPGAQGVCLPSLRPVGLHILHYCLPEARPGHPPSWDLPERLGPHLPSASV